MININLIIRHENLYENLGVKLGFPVFDKTLATCRKATKDRDWDVGSKDWNVGGEDWDVGGEEWDGDGEE